MSLSTQLSTNVSAFIDPETDPDVQTTSLNTILILIRSNPNLTSLITECGPFLTHNVAEYRTRSLLLLSTIITRLPTLKVEKGQLQSLYVFFIERMQDFPCLSPCLTGVVSCWQFHASFFDTVEMDLLWKVLFETLHVQGLGQDLRYKCYQCIHSVLLQKESIEAQVVWNGFIDAMSGEKDPRNLKLGLEMIVLLITKMTQVHSSRVLMKKMYDMVSCYFPITFQPPPNDPYGVTSYDLISGLRHALSASYIFAQWSLPMLLEKMASDGKETKVDALKTIEFVLARTESHQVSHAMLSTLQGAIYTEVVNHGSNEVLEAALGTICTISSKGASFSNPIWKSFTTPMILQVCSDIESSSPDSLLVIAAIGVAHAMAASCPFLHAQVLFQLLPILQRNIQVELASSESVTTTSHVRLETLLCHLKLFIDCVNREVDFSAHGHPFHEDVGQSVFASLAQSLTYDAEASHTPSRVLAIECLCHFMAYPPSLMISTSQVVAIIDQFTDLAVFDPEESVRKVGLQSLITFAQSPHFYSSIGDSSMSKLLDYLEQIPTHSSHDIESIFHSTLHAITEIMSVQSKLLSSLPIVLHQVIKDNMSFSTESEDCLSRTIAVLESIDAILKANMHDITAMDFCIDGYVANENDSVSYTNGMVFQILSVFSSQCKNLHVPFHDSILSSCESILRTVLQNCSLQQHTTTFQYALDTFLPAGETEFVPLSLNTGKMHPQSIILFAAIVDCAVQEVIIPRQSELLQAFTSMALGTCTGKVASSMSLTLPGAQCVASLLNKMQDGPDLDETLYELMDIQLLSMLQEPFTTAVAEIQLFVWYVKYLYEIFMMNKKN